MSFVIAAPEFVTAAAGDLANIGSALGAANSAAALPTTGLMSAAADEVSTQIAAMFGAYGRQFQAFSAQAAAFHNEFVSLLNGSALTYLTTEVANAEQTLMNTVNVPVQTVGSGAASAAALSLLGGGSGGLLGGLGSLLGGGSGASGLLGGLGSLLGGFALPPLSLPPFPNFGGVPNFGGLLSLLIGNVNLGGVPNFGGLVGALTGGINLGAGPLGPTFQGIGQDLGNFLSNELVNGLTLSNLASLVTGLPQDVPALQGLVPLLQSVLPGLFGQPVSGAVGAYPNPYQVLGDTTVFNLNLMGAAFVNHPFPILNQIYTNQNGYAQTFWSGVALDLQNFPANVPANIQLVFQGASTFNPAALGETFVNGASGYYGTVGSSLQQFGSALQGTASVFENDIGMAGTAIETGDYHGAVQDIAHALLGTFITGFDTSHLGISVTGTLLPPSGTINIAGPIGLLGPAGDLLPILTATGQQAQGLASLIPPTSIPGQMAQNFANAINVLTNGSVSADFSVTVAALPVGGTLAGEALFGLPLSVGFAILGPPFAAADGLATGATAFSTALQAGNALGALNAIGDTPAYVLNGMLNGQVLVDLPLPVTVSVAGVPTTLPATAHVPFDGLLVPPQPITATIPLDIVGIDVPINAPLGGTEFGGLFPTLLNIVPEQIAAAITPT